MVWLDGTLDFSANILVFDLFVIFLDMRAHLDGIFDSNFWRILKKVMSIGVV